MHYSYIGIFYTGHKNNILSKRLVYQAKSDIKNKGINWLKSTTTKRVIKVLNMTVTAIQFFLRQV